MNQTTGDFQEELAAKILLKHYGFVLRQARRFLPVPNLAEDVAQQVFVELLKKSGNYDIESDLRPLLMVVTRRTAQKIWHQEARVLPESLCRLAEVLRDELQDQRYDSVFVSSNDGNRVESLRLCLQKLSESGRELIKRYYFDGVTTDNLARQLQKRSDTVAKAIYRLREKLKDCIERTSQSKRLD